MGDSHLIGGYINKGSFRLTNMECRQSSSTKKLSKLFSIVIICILLSTFLCVSTSTAKDPAESNTHLALNSYHSKLNKLKQNTENIRRKVNNARKKEKLALAKLQKTQRELYRIQSNYLNTQRKLIGLERDIRSAQQGIRDIDGEIFGQTDLLKQNLRNIYIHKSDVLSSLAEALFTSDSIVEFFNTLYYQRRLINHELVFIGNIRDRQQELRELQEVWRKKQNSLSSVMDESEKLKRVVSVKKQEQYNLVDRLRRERFAYESAERQLEKESNKLTKTILELSDGEGIDVKDLIRSYYNYPVRAAITSPYGYRRHPIFGVRSFHSGIDLGARYGTPIKASNGGIVIYSGWYSGYGKTVIVSHGSGKTTLYAHAERIVVKNGDKVAQDQILAYVGSTGYSTGPHLHFEYRLSGKPQNPLRILR